jgi:hypothetical protein
MLKILITIVGLSAVDSYSYATECPLSVKPVLQELNLKNHKLEKDPSSTNGIREAGELLDKTKVMVESSGCEKLRSNYQFSYKDSKTPVSNSKHWLELAEKSFVEIQKKTLAKFIKKQKVLPLKKAVSVDSMLTLVKSTILQTKDETILRFETVLEPLIE